MRGGVPEFHEPGFTDATRESGDDLSESFGNSYGETGSPSVSFR